MRVQDLTTVYATTYLSEIQHGVSAGGYTNLRELRLNVQTDYSELDLEVYGETINEVLRLRSMDLPDLKKGDYLYLKKPVPIGTFQIGEETYNDYGPGEYQVKSIQPAYVGVKTVRNPTLIEAKKMAGETDAGTT